MAQLLWVIVTTLTSGLNLCTRLSRDWTIYYVSMTNTHAPIGDDWREVDFPRHYGVNLFTDQQRDF